MKYRDPKTVGAFENMASARFAFCGMDCRECKLSCWANKDKTRCDIYCREHPAEAARLMGLEVVEGHIGNATEMMEEVPVKKTDKPLTRFDQIKSCETPENMVVILNGNELRFCPKGYKAKPVHCEEPCGRCISNWLKEPTRPRFTPEEVADAKVLMRALRATGLKRNRYEDIYATSETTADTLLDSEMFPSLRPGQSVALSELCS